MMNNVRLIIPDLLLPEEIVTSVAADLSCPALQKMLGRGHHEMLEPVPLENILCGAFGLPMDADPPIARISAAYDRLGAGCWMRADPVHLSLQRDQMLVNAVPVEIGEAAVMCASLNEHFHGQGLVFVAAHPQRWYVRLEVSPEMRTTPLSRVLGGDMRKALPTGADAAYWHRLSNEVQMLLHAHPHNARREARGEPAINSLWFWGNGQLDGPLKQAYEHVSSDQDWVEMFAVGGQDRFTAWADQWSGMADHDSQLLVWAGLETALQRGDLAAWRSALQGFEQGYAQPLWQALRSGTIGRLQMDIPGAASLRRVVLSRQDSWAFWRPGRFLAAYPAV